MTQKQLQKEWQKVSFETLKNKPSLNGCYPSNIVRIREVLLLAQIELAKIGTKKIKDFTLNYIEQQ